MSIQRGGNGGKRQPVRIGPYTQLVVCFCPDHQWTACVLPHKKGEKLVCLNCSLEKPMAAIAKADPQPIDTAPIIG